MSNRLSTPTVIFHWLVGISFIVTLGMGKFVEGLPRGPEKFELLATHKSLGLMVLLMATLRIAWRLKEGEIVSVSVMPRWQVNLSKIIHYLLLIGTVAMPLSGVLMSVGGGHGLAFFGMELIEKSEKTESLSNLGGAIHGIGFKVLLVGLLLHIVGALKHQFIDKDGTLSRMLGIAKKS